MDSLESKLLRIIRKNEEMIRVLRHNREVLDELARRGVVKQNGDGTFDLKE